MRCLSTEATVVRSVPSLSSRRFRLALWTKDFSNRILVVVNLDPLNVQRGFVTLELDALDLAADATFEVHDLLTDNRYSWTGARNYIELRPAELPAHVFLI